MKLWLLAVAAAGAAEAVLPQTVTNGKSLLGTLEAPLLKSCLDFAGSGSECPQLWPQLGLSWPKMPAGKDRVYNFDITRGFLSPDGVNSSILLVNGAFPGPTLEANWGDTFVVTVNNKITGPEAGTALHWHGLTQKDTKFMDGVPSVTQCPIAPGKSFTYRFKADRVGTSWWHSHFSGQTSGGLFGALVIHGPTNLRYEYDLGPVLLSDRYHIDYRETISGTMAGQLVFSDNNLINGKMRFDCSKTTRPCTPNADISRFKFTSGKTHLLRLINSGAEGLQHFTIDGHQLTVISLDFVPVVPFTVKVVSLSPGQRANILVKGVGKPKESYWMRSDIDALPCSASTQPNALAAIYYEGANTSADPTSQKTPYTVVGCKTTSIDVATPLIPEAPPAVPAFTQNIDFNLQPNATGTVLFFANGRTFRADFNDALLSRATSPQFPFSAADPLSLVYDFGDKPSVRLVVQNLFLAPHPMHLHGHDFFVRAEGVGSWDGTLPNNPNPLRRDTTQLPGAQGTTPGYVVLDVKLNNPGIWGFHCHIFSHVSLGMYINFAYGKSAIEKLTVPPAISNNCNSWRAYAAANAVEQLDSGL